MLSLSDILAIIFGVTATLVGIAAVIATSLARDSRRRRVDPENQQSRNSAISSIVTSEPEIMIRFIELLPDIIHGHSPSNGTRNNRIHDASHERVD